MSVLITEENGWKNTKHSHATPCLQIYCIYVKETNLLTMDQLYPLLAFTALENRTILAQVLLVYKINQMDFFRHSVKEDFGLNQMVK